MLTVLLSLGASGCWGTADFLSGERARRVPVLLVLLISQAVGLVVVGAAVVVGGHGPPGDGFWAPVVLGSLAAVVGLGALYRGLAVGAMSVVAPISATSAIIPVVVGLATGDRPSPVQGAGIAVAILGVVLASREPGEGGGATATGVGLALLSAAGLGCSLVALKAASDADPAWAALAFRLVMLAMIGAAVAVTMPSPAGRRRGDLPALAIAGLLDGAATLLFATAFSRGLLSVVAVLGGLYPVVTVILAQTVLHERIARWQRLGVVAAIAGVAMIAAG
ncbi:MAG TPA: DMT family transporter [Actinomycetota bacterium]